MRSLVYNSDNCKGKIEAVSCRETWVCKLSHAHNETRNQLIRNSEHRLLKRHGEILYIWEYMLQLTINLIQYSFEQKQSILNLEFRRSFSYLRAQVLMDLVYCNWCRIHMHVPELNHKTKASIK